MCIQPADEDWRWQRDGRCRDPHFGPLFDTERPRTMNAAKQICLGCPVVRECLEFAVRADEPFGVWGGMTPKERTRHKRRRPRFRLSHDPRSALSRR